MSKFDKANKFIVENEKGGLILQAFGPDYLDKIFNDGYEEKEILNLGEILLDEKLMFYPKLYLDSFLKGDINKDELIMGDGVFTYPFNIQIGTPSLAIELAFGNDCKKNKSASAKGKKEEWVYFGEHREMERQVIVFKFKFTDDRLTSYEDNTETAFLKTFTNYKDFTNDNSITMSTKHTNSRRLFAQVSEGLSDKDELVKILSIDYIKDMAIEEVKDLFEKDEILDKKIELFEPYDDDGKYNLSKSIDKIEKEQRYITGTEEHEVHANEITHAINVLNKAEAEKSSIVENGQEFIDRYNSLLDMRQNYISLMKIDELSTWGYDFNSDDHKSTYGKIYDMILNGYRDSLDPEPPFKKEFEEFVNAHTEYKERKKPFWTGAQWAWFIISFVIFFFLFSC